MNRFPKKTNPMKKTSRLTLPLLLLSLSAQADTIPQNLFGIQNTPEPIVETVSPDQYTSIRDEMAKMQYICKNGNTVTYTNKPLGAHCTKQHMNGTQTVSEEEAAKARVEPFDTSLFKTTPAQSDIKILPTDTSVTNTAEAGNPKLTVKLRKGSTSSTSAKARAAELNRKAKIIPAPIVAAPPKADPRAMRKQILQGEVRKEQTALARAQSLLNSAKQKGDTSGIAKLTQLINDRKANIRAIQNEISR